MITDLVTVMIMMILPPDTGLVSDCSLAWSRVMCDYRVVCLNIDSLGVMTVVMEQSARSLYHGDHYQLAEVPLTTLPCALSAFCPGNMSVYESAICGLHGKICKYFVGRQTWAQFYFLFSLQNRQWMEVVRGRVAQCAMCNL